MSAHTPGPWVFEPPSKTSEWMGAIKGPGGVEVCSFGDGERYYPTAGCPPEEADASLITAAPDLLAAAKITEEAAQHSMECGQCHEFFTADGAQCQRMLELTARGVEMRLAAIAKAEGR